MHTSLFDHRSTPLHKRRGFKASVPAVQHPAPRAAEREHKRRVKAGLVLSATPRQPRDTSIGRGEQRGHHPNVAVVRELKLAPLGGYQWHVRAKHSGAHRISIWPEGRVAKPGRMG